jgi:hypothetical protein
MIKDITTPRRGATTIKIMILTTPLTITELHPVLATAAPTRPPTNVWEELEGSPYHQVTRFQIMAATSAAAITVRLITSGFITFLPIVVATLRGNTTNAMKLKKAAILTAATGDKTFVETIVAIELAESWNPLMKSKMRTRATTIIRNVICVFLIIF